MLPHFSFFFANNMIVTHNQICKIPVCWTNSISWSITKSNENIQIKVDFWKCPNFWSCTKFAQLRLRLSLKMRANGSFNFHKEPLILMGNHKLHVKTLQYFWKIFKAKYYVKLWSALFSKLIFLILNFQKINQET